jgi:hypothetical protein
MNLSSRSHNRISFGQELSELTERECVFPIRFLCYLL